MLGVPGGNSAMSDSCVACITIASLTQIPMQVSKWLAMCEANVGNGFKCVMTDLQILSTNKALRLLMVYDERDARVMQVPGWAEPYTSRQEREALVTVPIPAWAGSMTSARGSAVLHLSSAKYLAEILLTLFNKCRQIDVPDRTSLISCFTSNMAKMAHDEREKCVMVPRPLTEGQLDSVLELADQWKSAFAEQARRKQEAKEAKGAGPWLPPASEFPSLLPSRDASPLEAGSRAAYLHCNEWTTPSAIHAYATAWRGQSLSSLGFEPDSPFVPKINAVDQARLGRVVYLGPGKAQRVWYPWSFALHAPRYTAALTG